MSAAKRLTDWTAHGASAIGDDLARADHRLGKLAAFSDEGLAELLDRHPRAELQAYTMDDDAGTWIPVELGTVTGRDLLRAVSVGRLWLNVLRVDRSTPAVQELIDRLFAELREEGCADLEPDSWRATLLVSSPSARVPYHADASPNALWHIRGRKQVFVYPRDDERLISRSDLEEIYVAARDEYLRYDPSFDASAQVVALEPGQVVAWPQNSPHRVENVEGLNVSLSCEFATGRSRRREYTYCGAWFAEQRLHLPVGSMDEKGAAPALRRFVYRAVRKAHIVRPKHQLLYMAPFVIDPDAPGGVTLLPEPVRATFSTA